MCSTCFNKGDLVARFNKFREAEYKCGTCESNSTHCLPQAIVHGQKPPRVFFGPRFEGIGTFPVFGVHPTEAFSAARVDGLMGACDSFLARHTWMPELATAMSTGSIKEVVYLGQTGTPSVRHLAEPSTSDHLIMDDWHREHQPVVDLATELFGPSDTKKELHDKIERAVPVFAQREIQTFVDTYFPEAGITVHAGLYDTQRDFLCWVRDPQTGSFTKDGNTDLHARYEKRRHLLNPEPEDRHDVHRFFGGCMDSRAIPTHVFGLTSTENASDAFVSTSMGGLWAEYGTPLARLTWMPELAMAMEHQPDLNEYVFLGHTGCAGAKLLASEPVNDPLRLGWQKLFQKALLPLANKMFKDDMIAGDVQAAIEKAIPVFMERNVRRFLDDWFPQTDISVNAYLYKMHEGNLMHLSNNRAGKYTALTHHEPLDYDMHMEACPRIASALQKLMIS